MASSGGTITLRLGLAGEAEVKAALASLGPVGAKALREIEAAQAGPNAGMRALNAVGKDVAAGMEEAAGGIGAAGSALSAIGPGGLAAAAGIAAAIEAARALAEQVKGAMEFGEAIETAAKKAGVSTKALQEYRYAADQSGVATGAADEALTKFSIAFGGASEGAKRYLTIFKQLGFTPEQMKSFSSIDEALDATVDKLAGLKNVADRDYFAKKLGLEALIPVLANGQDHIAKLRKEASDLGAVMDEATVAALSRAEQKFKSASDVINVQFKSSLVALTPVLISLMQEIAKLATALDSFMAAFERVEDRGTEILKRQLADANRDQLDLVTRVGPQFFLKRRGPGDAAANRVWNEYQTNQQTISGIEAELAKRGGADTPTPNLGPSSGALGGGGHAGPSPDEIAQHNRALADQAQQDLLAATKRELTARLALTDDVEARADLQKRINALDDQAEVAAQDRREAEAKAQLDKLQASKTATAAEKASAQAAYDAYIAQEQLAKAENETAQHARDQLAERTKQTKQAEDAAALEAATQDGKIAQLRAQLELTHDMGERRRLALEIFDLETAEKQAQLQLTLAKQKLAGDVAGAAVTQQQIDNLGRAAPIQRQGVSNANPADAWDAWVLKQKQDLPSVQQEWANLRVNGIEAFNNALFDGEGRLNSFKDIFHSLLTSMLKDLEQYLLKQAEVGVFGGGGGGSSGVGVFGGGPQGGGVMSLLGNLFGGGGAAAAGASVGSSVGNMMGAMFAGGGLIRGPGTSTSDSIWIRASDGEGVLTAAAMRQFGPVLDAMNAAAERGSPRFASGGRVGAGSAAGGSSMFGETHYHDNRDFSIHAADHTQVEALAQQQRAYAKQEPARFVAYARAVGLVAKG